MTERRGLVLVLVAFAGLAFAPLAGLLIRVWTQGGHLGGGDGFLVLDALQYVNWTRQAGEHLLIENLYDITDGPRTFLHPGLTLSGALHAAGLGAIAAYQLLKPLAILALWAGAAAWSRRLLPDARSRIATVALTLFFASPVAAVVALLADRGSDAKLHFDFLSGELTATNYVWGYIFTGVAVGLMPLGLLAFERGRVGWAAAAGLLIAWLQPWQGVTYALILAGASLLAARRRGEPLPLRPLVLATAATGAPLVYYLALSLTDPSWELAGAANDFGTWPWWVTVIGLAPLAVPAATGWRSAPDDFAGWALRLWPFAALAVYVQPFGTFPAHSWQGVVLPLATLAFLGVGRRLGALALVAALALLIIPGTGYRIDELRRGVKAGQQPFFLTDGEHAALRWLAARPEPGGVLAPIYTGLLVPGHTGRETWVGAGSWTPDFDARVQEGERLFSGRMGREEAERFVRSSGARWVLSDCHGREDISVLIARVTGPPRRFGCATVYEVRE